MAVPEEVLPLLLPLPLLPPDLLPLVLPDKPPLLPMLVRSVLRKRYSPRFSVQPLLTARASRKPGTVEMPGTPPAVPMLVMPELVWEVVGETGVPSGFVAPRRSKKLMTMGATVLSV